MLTAKGNDKHRRGEEETIFFFFCAILKSIDGFFEFVLLFFLRNCGNRGAIAGGGGRRLF